jgi:hypothetical protein
MFAGLLVLPAAVARILSSPLSVLTLLAAIHCLACVLWLATTPISLYFCIQELLKKDWKSAGAFAFAASLPLATFYLGEIVNGPGFEVIMGV